MMLGARRRQAGDAGPYGDGERGLSRASRSRGDRRWQGQPRLEVASLEAKTLRLRSGCGGRKLSVILRGTGPEAGK